MLIRLYRLGRHILLMLLIYNYLFPIRFTFFPNFSDVFILLSLFVLFSVVLYRRAEKVLLNKDGFYIIISWSGLLILAAFSIIINNSIDFGVMRVLLNYIITWMYAICLMGCVRLGLFGEGLKLEDILKIIVLSCFVIALSVLLEIISTPFKSIVLNLVYKSGNINYFESFRASGFSTAGGASLSFGLAIGSGISLFMALHYDVALRRLSYLFMAVSIFLATIFVGRTGLIFASLFIIASLRYFTFAKSFYSGLVLLVAYNVLFQFFSLIPDDALHFYTEHSFELFNNYLEYGSIETTSSDEVAGMYFLPSVKHFIFGAGFMNTPLHGYILPDPGYMKVLLSFGVIGFIVFYSLSAFMVYSSYRYLCQFDARYRFLLLVILISFFIYEAKEPGLYQNYGFRVLMLLFAFGAVEKNLYGYHKYLGCSTNKGVCVVTNDS